MKHITEEMALDAIYGGWFFGGGGGGSIAGGKEVVKTVTECGGFDICSIDEIPADSTVLTAALVGSPSAGGAGPDTDECRRAYELFKANTDCNISAFIANEAGAHSITNGWIAAAASGLPMLDAACNGRAHPTGVMGSMGLDQNASYLSAQTAVGGRADTYVELFVKGSTANSSRMVREASVRCKGYVTVLRNPASAAFVKENSALGALSMCMEAGRIIRAGEGCPEEILKGLKEKLALKVLASGKAKSFELESRGGFDVGRFLVSGTEITFWNEYMTAEKDGERLATFPDLIMTLNGKSGLPVCSAAVTEGSDLIVVSVPGEKLLLGRTMSIKELFEPCEQATGKEMISYVFK